MALSDLLSSLLAVSPAAVGAIDPGQSIAPGGQTTTPVSELMIQGQKQKQQQPVQMIGSPSDYNNLQFMPYMNVSTGADQTDQGPQINYSNSGASDAINQANMADNTQAARSNTNVYGLLPHGLQHGTLSSLLGILGDSMLVSAGRQPEYLQHMQRQQLGQAFAGEDLDSPNSVSAATQRAMATGAPGAIEAGQQNAQMAEQARLRQATMEQNNWYRQNQINTRNGILIERQAPQIKNMLDLAQTPEDYKTRYAQAEAIAQRIGPEYHASDFGAISPDQWQPDMKQGMTTNQKQVSEDKAKQRDQSQTDTELNVNGRITAAGIGAGRPTDAQLKQQVKSRIDSGTASDSDKALWQVWTQLRKGSGRGLAPTVAPNSPQAATPGMPIAHDAKGNKVGWNGKAWVPVR